ncbi:MAG: hypothetical protein GY772_12035 [bacterium]|nr:hypothetical protein [bacterium]
MAPGVLWRDGLNLHLSGPALSDASARLVAEQLDSAMLAVSAVDAKVGRGLETTRLLRDGDSLPASALFFDEEQLLSAWLKQPGHDKYRDRIVEVLGVLKQGEARMVWAVLVGAAQSANCYSGIRKAPNAKVVFTPVRGFNKGARELRISTRNGAGIAKGSPILLDYGSSFQTTQAGGGDNFRGALDTMFDAQRQWLPDEAAAHDADTKKERNEAAMQAETEAKRKAEEQLQAEQAKKARVEEEAKQAAEKAAALAEGVRGDEAPKGSLLKALSAPSCEFRLIERAHAGNRELGDRH